MVMYSSLRPCWMSWPRSVAAKGIQAQYGPREGLDENRRLLTDSPSTIEGLALCTMVRTYTRDMEGFTTARLANAGGVNVETIRYYERHGLLPKPPRTHSGYRVFSEDSVKRLRFIRHAQELGFSLTEIKELLSL